MTFNEKVFKAVVCMSIAVILTLTGFYQFYFKIVEKRDAQISGWQEYRLQNSGREDMQAGRFAAIYNGYPCGKGLTASRFSGNIDGTSPNPRPLRIRQLLVSDNGKPECYGGITTHCYEGQNLKTSLAARLPSFSDITPYIQSILAFLVSVGLTCWGYLSVYYGRGWRAICGIIACALAWIPMFYAVGNLIYAVAQ